MSMECLTQAFNASIKGASKAVLIALADRANRGGYCFASLSDIAFRAGCDRRTVMRSIDTLEKSGFILVIRDKGRTNHYMILPAVSDDAGDNMSQYDESEQADFEQNLSTSSDIESPKKVINSGDNVSKTGDMLSKTRGVMSPKPNITQLTQKRAREESPKNVTRQPKDRKPKPRIDAQPPMQPDRPQRNRQAGIQGLRGIKAILKNITPTQPDQDIAGVTK